MSKILYFRWTVSLKLNLSLISLLILLKYLSDFCVTFKFSPYRWNCTKDVTEPAIKKTTNEQTLTLWDKGFLYFLQKILWLLRQQNPQAPRQCKQIFKISSYFSCWGKASNGHSRGLQTATRRVRFPILSHLQPKSSSGETNSGKTCSIFTAHSNPCFPWSCWIWSHLPDKRTEKKMAVSAMCTPSHVRTKLNPYGSWTETYQLSLPHGGTVSSHHYRG